MPILPMSLFGRLVLVLLAGLMAAQLLSAVILFQDRGQSLYQASGLQSAQRLGDIVRLVESVEPRQRENIIQVLNSPALQLRLSRDAWSEGLPRETESGLSGIFHALLRQNLGDERPLKVTVSETMPTWPVQAPMRHHHGPGMGMMHREHMASMGVLPPEGLSFLAQVQLQDGSWLSFGHRVPEEVFAWPRRILLTLAVLLFSVIVLSMIAVRWVSRPLAVLADAAEQLGRDIHQPPLQPAGPSEVKRAAHAFNTMQERLIRFIEDRTRILSAVSHDLKTPITRLRLRAELVEDPELRASVVRDLDDMQRMTRESLDFLRGIEEHEEIQAIDIPALLENVKDDTEDTGGVVMLENIGSTPYPGRPLALKRCIANLVENASRYGKRAHVNVRSSPDRLEIQITDEGPGIPEKELEQVFEPFYRLESSRSRSTGGTGLGLSIARNIARAHGGDVVLRNHVGGGLEVVLTLPR
ncbi:MAG: ATP-binding protein [Pseudomonadota bacterium]